MTWSGKNVYGSEKFYQLPAHRSLFFLADTIMLLLASAVDFYIVVNHGSHVSGPGMLRLVGVLVGMWLLWWKAYSSHEQIRALYNSGDIQSGQTSSAVETLSNAAASMTHIGMFMTFLLNATLLIAIDSLLRNTH